METLVLNSQILIVLGILAFTIFLFVSEIVRVDLAAIIVMVLLGVSGMVSGDVLFTGFSSNAVISIIAVMIIGAGLDRTGIMTKVAAFILKIGGKSESRLIPIISGTVGTISSFMQNVGAAALFLPVVRKISQKSKLSISRLLMPMGFCAILGGTMTMVGSSPLILLNDLILTSNKALPEGVTPMETFGLFDVSPVGIALVLTGIIYFVLFGKYLLPSCSQDQPTKNSMKYFRDTYGFTGDFYELEVLPESLLIGKTFSSLEKISKAPAMVALHDHRVLVRFLPPKGEKVSTGALLLVLGEEEQVKAFAKKQKLKLKENIEIFEEMLDSSKAGVAEVVLHPASQLVGKKISDEGFLSQYQVSLLCLFRQGECLRGKLENTELQAGDTLILHSPWKSLAAIHSAGDFIVTTPFKYEKFYPEKMPFALFFFAVSLSLILFSDLKLSISLMIGAVGMIVTGVMKIDEAYKAVDWKTIFLLASLIPLGIVVESSGTAAWIAQSVLQVLGDVPVWGLQVAVAVLATFFTLVMSNVGATVLLVPLAINIALASGGNPALFALTVGLATSNSFLIPTHQVNALLMGPGGYQVKDFMKAGGIMTLLFLIVLCLMLNLFY